MASPKSDGVWKEWETILDSNGMKVEVRKNAQSGLLQTRATSVVGCTTDELWKALTTPELYMKLMPKTKETRDFEEKPKQKTCRCYQRVSGGPVSDRDYTLRVKWTIEDGSSGKKYRREWRVDNDGAPPPAKGVVRVEVHDGSWSLAPLPGKKTAFEQRVYIELGGSLWAIVANTAVKDAARELLESLREKYGE